MIIILIRAKKVIFTAAKHNRCYKNPEEMHVKFVRNNNSFL